MLNLTLVVPRKEDLWFKKEREGMHMTGREFLRLHCQDHT